MQNDGGTNLSRRSLITKGATVGAIAWVAPSIISVQAAGAASLPGFTLGQSGATVDHDVWLAAMVIDLNSAYTNSSATDQTITPDEFSFTAGTGPAVLGAEIQPFVFNESSGLVTAIGTNIVPGPLVPGATSTSPFGGAAFPLAPGETIRLGALTIGTSGGSPIGFDDTAGSSSLTGGPDTADSGSLPGVGAAPVDGTNAFTTSYNPRTYQMSATFEAA